jgi:hypothetical protein
MSVGYSKDRSLGVGQVMQHDLHMTSYRIPEHLKGAVKHIENQLPLGS